MRKILVINPGSTSTKISLFEEDNEILGQSINHTSDELKHYNKIYEQADLRVSCVKNFMEKNGVDIKSLAGVVGRGGLLKPIESGVYAVNEKMLTDLKSGIYGEHASNLGGIIAEGIAKEAGCKAYIVDPVVVDELAEESRFSGLPELPRKSIFHALNQKSAAREIAGKISKKYDECNFIVAHLGGGISVGAHKQGKVVDVNNALDGDGPFSPERAGGLPCGQLAELCFSGKYTLSEIKKMLTGRGGMVAHMGINNFGELCKMVAGGDTKARKFYNAMTLKIAKEIAALSAILEGKIDRIILTGGMAYDKDFVQKITSYVSFLAAVEVVAGEREMLSLARGFVRISDGLEKVKEYQ